MFALFSIFKDDDGTIYREDFQTFLDKLEENLKVRRVTRASLIHNLDRSSVVTRNDTTHGVSSSQIEFLVGIIKDTLSASNGKIDELMNPDSSPVARAQIQDILMKLNNDLFENVVQL